MAYTYPAPLSDNWNVPYEAILDDMDGRITIADTKASNATSGLQAGAWLDGFSGSTSDAKLTTAMSTIAAETVKRPIWLTPGRQYSFSQANRQLFSGFKLVCPGGFGNQQRAANSIPCDVRFTGSGTWWVNPGTTYDVMFSGVGIQGNSSSTFMMSNPGVLWTSVFRDLGFNLWKHVFGQPAAKFLNTAILIDGWGNINNSYDTAASFGGSDSNLFVGGEWLIDSPTSIMSAASYHLRLDYQEKTNIGAIYMTAERSSGIYIVGGGTTTGLVLSGGLARVEGRNTGAPCVGSNIRIAGGGVTIRDWWVAYGGTAFNSNGHTGEGGIIQQDGGTVLYDGIWYDRATGVAETVPFINVSGGKARVRNIQVGTKGGSWSGLPRVKNSGGTIDADNSVTVI